MFLWKDEPSFKEKIKTMMTVAMCERELHELWDKLELAMPRPYPDFSFARPSEYLLRAYKAGLLTWDPALEMYLCCTGFAVAL